MNISEEKYEQQYRFYENFKPYSDIEIIEHFIASEKEAIKYDFQENLFQGCFYPLYHDEIKRILGSSMQGISDEQKIDAFYYALRLNNIYAFSKKNYPYFKTAFCRLLNDIDNNKWIHSNTGKLNGAAIFILFNGIDSSISNERKLAHISFLDFKGILSFIYKCSGYYEYENIPKKKAHFQKYMSNETLLNLISKNTLPFLLSEKYSNDSRNILLGIYVLLFFHSEKVFEKLHKQVNKISDKEQARIDFDFYFNFLSNYK